MNSFYNGLVSERTKLSKRLKILNDLLEAYSQNTAEARVTDKAPKAASKLMARKKFGTKKNGVHFEARQRREWIENYFSKGGEPLTTTEFHHKIKEAGFNCTKAALWNMLYNTSGLRCDKNTRKWALYGFSNKVARELESQLNQIVGA